MSWLAATWLFVWGIVSLPLVWNAAKPIGDPTRRYSPWWLPAMVITETAPLWLALHAGVLAIGVLGGGLDSAFGIVGVVMLSISMVLLIWVRTRTAIGVRRLRRHVRGRVHRARGAGRWLGRPIPTPPGVVERHGVEWRHGLTLDVTRPAGDHSDLPVVVYVHGGGWTGGDPQRQARDLYHALALDGWASLGIRYPFTPHVTVEDQIAVVRDAVRWARTETAAHGIEPTTVVLAGGSAGGHLAAMAALTADDDLERVAACVGLYGVYDMANRNRTRAHWDKIRNEVMLATVDEQPERYRSVSPIDRVHDDTPPFLILHGTHDTLVPPGEGEQFVAALRSRGRPVEFVPVYGAQHAFDALSGVTSRTAAAAVRDWLRVNVLRQAPTA